MRGNSRGDEIRTLNISHQPCLFPSRAVSQTAPEGPSGRWARPCHERRNPPFRGGFRPQCAGEDLNLHDPIGSQGPQLGGRPSSESLSHKSSSFFLVTGAESPVEEPRFRHKQITIASTPRHGPTHSHAGGLGSRVRAGVPAVGRNVDPWIRSDVRRWYLIRHHDGHVAAGRPQPRRSADPREWRPGISPTAPRRSDRLGCDAALRWL